MNHASTNKSVTKATASVAASATFSHEIDTLGFRYAAIDVVYSPFTAATTSYASVLKVQESDASGSGQADISGLSVTAGAGSTTGANIGAVARFNVDLRGRKRLPDGRDEPRQHRGGRQQRPADQGRAGCLRRQHGQRQRLQVALTAGQAG